MSPKGHLLRGAILGLALTSGSALGQVLGMCGEGAGNFTGELDVLTAQIEGGIILDGQIDCAALCGGGGNVSG